MTTYKTYSSNKIDWRLLFLYTIIIAWGLLNLYSSDYIENDTRVFWNTFYGKQLFFAGISIVLAIVILFTETTFFSFTAYLFYISVIVLLIGVLLWGKVVNGAKAWIGIGDFGVQPAEFSKLAISLFFARYISKNKIDLNNLSLTNILIFSIVIGIPVVLIVLQPDYGTILSFVSLIIVFFRFGLHYLFIVLFLILATIFTLAIRVEFLYLYVIINIIAVYFFVRSLKNKKTIWQFLLIAGILLLIFFVVSFFIQIKLDFGLFLVSTIISVFAFVFLFIKREEKSLIVVVFFALSIITAWSSKFIINEVLKKHHRDRIEVLFDESIDPKGIGYNLLQSKIAIASGGFWGKGYLKGTQTKYNFVPEHKTDFIFCTLVEEFGFAGALVFFVLFFWLIYLIIKKSEEQVSLFSRIYGYFLASFLIVHILINISMVIGLFPVVGIPLPFFSYGGSSFLTFSIMLFIFIKLDTEKNLNL